jgi:hypothetical protein
MTELHVIPDERTITWRVYQSDAPEPLSQHTDATAAELAAQAWAERRGAERIFIHDCYHRTHEPARSLAGRRARTREQSDSPPPRG